MTAFVLVHGSGQNASSWSRVGDTLRARGHDVTAPDLPKQAPDWGLQDYAAWIEAGARWFDESQAEGLAREFLFHDCDEDTLAWALGTLEVTETQHVVTLPCPLAEWPDVAAAAIVADGDRTLTPDWCRRASRDRLGREPLEVRAGHCPHTSRPEEIARLLEGLAEQRVA